MFIILGHIQSLAALRLIACEQIEDITRCREHVKFKFELREK